MQLGEKKTSQYFWLWEIWPLERGVPSGKGKVTWVSHVSVAQCLQRTFERSGGATRRGDYRRRTYHVIYTSCKKLHFEIKLIPAFHCIILHIDGSLCLVMVGEYKDTRPYRHNEKPLNRSCLDWCLAWMAWHKTRELSSAATEYLTWREPVW